MSADTPFVPWPDNVNEDGVGIRCVAAGETLGLHWAVMRRNWVVGGATGPSCTGYVRLPDGHPWHDRSLQDDDTVVNVHGGITYGPVDGWIGFDYRHYCDEWEGDSEMFRALVGDNPPHPLPCTQEMVVDECQRLCMEVTASSRSATSP